MLIVKHRVGISPIQGLGVFCEENISKGQIIWKQSHLTEIKYTIDDWAKVKQELAPECFKQFEKYSYKFKNIYYLCIDNSQFMNHGVDTANMYSDETNNTMVASRNISAGEELICNYFEFCDDDDLNIQIIKKFDQRKL